MGMPRINASEAETSFGPRFRKSASFPVSGTVRMVQGTQATGGRPSPRSRLLRIKGLVSARNIKEIRLNAVAILS